MIIKKIQKLYQDYFKLNGKEPTYLYMDYATAHEFFYEYYKKYPYSYSFLIFSAKQTFLNMIIKKVDIYNNDKNFKYISVINDYYNFYLDGFNNNICKNVYSAKQRYIELNGKVPKIIYMDLLTVTMLIMQTNSYYKFKDYNYKLESMNLIVKDLIFDNGKQVNILLED